MLIVPDELDLLAFFENEPIDKTPKDGYFCYRLTDGRGIELYFSYHIIEASVQARLTYLNCELATVSEECADKLTIEKDETGEFLACTFELGGAKSKMIVRVRPFINIYWYTLRV